MILNQTINEMKAEYEMSVEFPGIWRKARLILDGKEGETSKELMDRVANEVEGWFNGRYPVIQIDTGVEPPAQIRVDKPIPEDQRIAALIGDIYACTKLEGSEGLLTWKTLASSNKDAQSAYNIMLNKLSK